jgi:O-antigen/teichoic acid export membrane protein
MDEAQPRTPALLMLKSFLMSPSLRVATAFALSGAAFAIGNLILAHVLPAREYGLVSLIIGLIAATLQIAPLGIDLFITRRGLRLGKRLRRTALFASVCTALVVALVSAVAYDLTPVVTVCLLAAIAAAGASQAAAAHFQSQKEFKTSVPIIQASNWTLVLIGALTALSGAQTATFPVVLMTASGLAVGAFSWWLLIKRDDGLNNDTTMAGHWRETLALVTVTGAGAIFMHLERLVLPATVGIEDLAVFGVLASLVGSPFRIIQGAIAYTVVPGLRDAKTVAQRRQLLLKEGRLVTVVLLLGSTVIWYLAGPLAHFLLAGRYDLSKPLIAATLVSGALKVLSAVGTSIVSALAPESGVRALSIGSWLCVGVSAAASFPAAPWGLTGVIYAISIGWLLRCVIAGWIALPHLR